MFVALREGEKASIKEIAAAFSISENHLVKVVHKLGKLGHLETVLVVGGGVSLNKSASEIIVGDVVRAVEPMAIVECFPPRQGECCIAGMCELQAGLKRAAAAFLAELDKLTLADLVRNDQALRRRRS